MSFTATVTSKLHSREPQSVRKNTNTRSSSRTEHNMIHSKRTNPSLPKSSKTRNYKTTHSKRASPNAPIAGKKETYATVHSKQNTSRPSEMSITKPPSNGGHVPPWKVMSTKDIQLNIQREIQRRQDIEEGKRSSSDGVQSNKEQKIADISSSRNLLSSTDRNLLSWKRFHPDSSPGGVQYIGSYLNTRLPPCLGVPEVAFLGRSNVGKSSLLNKLCSQTSAIGHSPSVSKPSSMSSSSTSSISSEGTVQLARVGKTPGATASVNLYALLSKAKKSGGNGMMNKPLLGLVDLPGFGYAKLSKEVKESVEVAAERYLNKRHKKELALCILLVDIRRAPSDDDRSLLAALYDLGVPLLVVATKVDKLSSNELSKSLEEVRLGLGLPEGQPFHVSSVTGEGIRELWKIILDACEDRVKELREQMETGGTSRDQILDQGMSGSDNIDDQYNGSIPLDDDGYMVEDMDEEEMDGYQWLQRFGSDFDRKISDDKYDSSSANDEQAMMDRSARSTSLKSLKRKAKDLMKKGEL